MHVEVDPTVAAGRADSPILGPRPLGTVAEPFTEIGNQARENPATVASIESRRVAA